MTEHEFPFVPQSLGDAPHGRFSATPRNLHKGSKAESSQSTTNKDNSGIGEDEAVLASDRSAAARDDALSVTAKIGDDGKIEVNKNEVDNTGRIEIGDGNTIHVESLDGEFAVELLEGAADFGRDAIDAATDFGLDAVEGALEFGEEALATNERTVIDTLDFAGDIVEQSSDLALEAIQANGELTLSVVDSQQDLTLEVLDSNGELAEYAISEIGNSNDNMQELVREALSFAEESQRSSNDLIESTTGSYAEFVGDKTDDAESTVNEKFQRNALIGIGILAVATVTVAFKAS